MQWLESDFGGVDRINVDSKEIWTPWMEQISDADGDYMFSTIWLNSDGNTSMVLVGKFVGYCDVDLLYFPLDEQVCGFVFISPRNNAAELNFSLIKDSVEITSMVKHGEWNIFESNAYRILYNEPDIDLEVVGLKFDLNLRRRPQFVLIHTTAPLALIALLNMITFVVPILSGERISFSVSILLALIFFTSNIVDNIPHSSARIPLLSMASAAITVLCTMNVIISVIFSRVAATKFKPVSGCLKAFVRFIVRVKFGIKVRKKQINADSARALHKCNGNKPDDSEKDNPTINETYCKTNHSGEDFEITWIIVADIFDWIMFYVHLLVVGTGVVLTFLFVIGII